MHEQTNKQQSQNRAESICASDNSRQLKPNGRDYSFLNMKDGVPVQRKAFFAPDPFPSRIKEEANAKIPIQSKSASKMPRNEEATQIIRIKVSDAVIGLVIANMSGEVVSQKTVSGNEVPLNGLKGGIYWVGMRLSNGNTISKKIQVTSSSIKIIFEVSQTNKANEEEQFENWQQENLQKVKAVKSFAVKGLEEKKGVSENNLQYRINLRISKIEGRLKELDKWKKEHSNLPEMPKWWKEKYNALKNDKSKTLEQIIQEKDSKFTDESLRNKIIQSNNAIKQKKKEIKSATKKWHEYDKQFVGSIELMNILKEISISPAELKALIGQESGDLNLSEERINTGKYVGIGQIGPKEAATVGYKPEDRKDPEKSILMAAKILKRKANATGLKLSDFSSSQEYKSFVFAAYNKGQGTVKTAMELAKTQGKDNRIWKNLIDGGTNSPMYKAIYENWPKDDPLGKYNEVVRYVSRIFKRLE